LRKKKLNWVEPDPIIFLWTGLGPNIRLGHNWPSHEQCSPLFTDYVNSGEQGGEMKQKKKKGRGKGWPAVAATIGCTTGGDKRRRWWFAVAATSSLSFYFFFFVLLVFRPLSLFFFSFFFSFLSVLSPFPSLLPSSLLVMLSPSVFIGKIGEREAGAATVLSPQKLPEEHISSLFSNTWKALGKVGRHLFEREMAVERSRWKQGNKSSLPCFLHVQGKKKTYGVVQNGTVLGLFF